MALVPLATRPGVVKKTEMPHLLKAGALLLGSMVLSLSQPAVLEKLNHYVLDSSYFHTYGLRNEVFGPEDFIAESIGMKVAAVQDVVVEFFEHSWLAQAQHHASQKQGPCFEQVWHFGFLHNPRACRQGDECHQKCEREAVVPKADPAMQAPTHPQWKRYHPAVCKTKGMISRVAKA